MLESISIISADELKDLKGIELNKLYMFAVKKDAIVSPLLESLPAFGYSTRMGGRSISRPRWRVNHLFHPRRTFRDRGWPLSSRPLQGQTPTGNTVYLRQGYGHGRRIGTARSDPAAITRSEYPLALIRF